MEDEEFDFNLCLACAKAGNPNAQYDIANYYEDTDIHECVKWLTLAAEQEHPYAMDNLARLYGRGIGVKQDIPKAIELYQKACSKNVSDSLYSLGMIYYFGDCVEKDEQKGFEYLLQAANSNNPLAAYTVGKAFYEGNSVKQDLEKAEQYLMIAWQQGMMFEAQKLLLEIERKIE